MKFISNHFEIPTGFLKPRKDTSKEMTLCMALREARSNGINVAINSDNNICIPMSISQGWATGHGEVYDAPCLIYIAGQKDSISLDVDCTLAASYFMFSAADRGLGTCWVDLGSVIKDHDLHAYGHHNQHIS